MTSGPSPRRRTILPPVWAGTEPEKAYYFLLCVSVFHKKNRGPTLPAFLSPGVAAVLQEKYDLKPTTTPEADLAACLGE